MQVSKSVTNGTIADYVDGDVVKRNESILSEENSLTVILYYDEVELCNCC